MSNVHNIKDFQTCGLQTFTAAWLGEEVFPDISFVVPRYIAQGLTILAGRPKAGKSYLALNIAVAIATGAEVLGEKVEQGDVLYLAPDVAARVSDRMGSSGRDGPGGGACYPPAVALESRKAPATVLETFQFTNNDGIMFKLYLDEQTFWELRALADKQRCGVGGVLRNLAKTAIASK
jgi:hypothetical protein